MKYKHVKRAPAELCYQASGSRKIRSYEAGAKEPLPNQRYRAVYMHLATPPPEAESCSMAFGKIFYPSTPSDPQFSKEIWDSGDGPAALMDVADFQSIHSSYTHCTFSARTIKKLPDVSSRDSPETDVRPKSGIAVALSLPRLR